MEKIRIGVFGAGRGIDLAENFLNLGCEIVALCEFNKKRAKAGLEELGIDVPVFEAYGVELGYSFLSCLKTSKKLSWSCHNSIPCLSKISLFYLHF